MFHGVPTKYPLEVVKRVREERVEAKTKDLAVATERLTEARAVAAERSRIKAEFERRCSEAAQVERTRLEGGALVAGDLIRGAAWAAGRDMERAVYVREL